MSAFAALKTQDAASIFFIKDEDNEVIEYQPNSSDSEPENSNAFIQTATPREQSEALVVSTSLHGSNFLVTDENCIYQADSLIIGLKEGEFILVVGQLKLSILRGVVLINQQHYISELSKIEHLIVAPQSQSLPTISSTELRNNDIQVSSDIQPPFLQKFKTVIKLRNHFTGLENIGTYYKPLKRFFTSKLDEDESVDSSPTKHSFEIVVTKTGFNGLTIDKAWSDELKTIKHQTINLHDPQTIMVIGNKNSGKSTFSKSIINELVQTSNISFLDLDPGQSEFSPPYCLTLSTVNSEIFGMNIIDFENDENFIQYFGYTTPLSQPQLYLIIITKLINKYLSIHKPKGNHLIINTPGWIKGYGKELLMKITEMVNPSKLILLSSCLELENRDNIEILNGLSFGNCSIIPGMFQTSKYSPAQLRTINKLIYFHSPSPAIFDFTTHILQLCPKKISFQTNNSGIEFVGINCVTILNFDVTNDFDYTDMFTMLDSSIVGVYAIEDELFHAISPSLYKNNQEGYPRYLNFTNYLDLITHDEKIEFMGLCMIHSIDLQQCAFNLYSPDFVQKSISNKISSGYKLILVKGEGEIPECELLNKDILINIERKTKLQKKKQNFNESKGTLYQIPYITLDGKHKHGGVWRMRRNVMRRKHQN